MTQKGHLFPRCYTSGHRNALNARLWNKQTMLTLQMDPQLSPPVYSNPDCAGSCRDLYVVWPPGAPLPPTVSHHLWSKRYQPANQRPIHSPDQKSRTAPFECYPDSNCAGHLPSAACRFSCRCGRSTQVPAICGWSPGHSGTYPQQSLSGGSFCVWQAANQKADHRDPASCSICANALSTAPGAHCQLLKQ